MLIAASPSASASGYIIHCYFFELSVYAWCWRRLRTAVARNKAAGLCIEELMSVVAAACRQLPAGRHNMYIPAR